MPRPSNPHFPRAPSGHIGRPRDFTEDQIAAALKVARGNYTRAAAALTKAVGRPVRRTTIALYVNRSPALAQLCEDLKEVKLDLIEDLAYETALRGDGAMQRFILQTQGAKRGWSRKAELTGSVSGKLDVGVNVDLSKASDAELKLIEAVLGKVMGE